MRTLLLASFFLLSVTLVSCDINFAESFTVKYLGDLVSVSSDDPISLSDSDNYLIGVVNKSTITTTPYTFSDEPYTNFTYVGYRGNSDYFEECKEITIDEYLGVYDTAAMNGLYNNILKMSNDSATQYQQYNCSFTYDVGITLPYIYLILNGQSAISFLFNGLDYVEALTAGDLNTLVGYKSGIALQSSLESACGLMGQMLVEITSTNDYKTTITSGVANVNFLGWTQGDVTYLNLDVNCTSFFNGAYIQLINCENTNFNGEVVTLTERFKLFEWQNGQRMLEIIGSDYQCGIEGTIPKSGLLTRIGGVWVLLLAVFAFFNLADLN